MYDTFVHEAGGYRFSKGVFQYSSGVCAEPGYRIERAEFAEAPTLADGFKRIVKHLESLGRPADALCAMELRSPAPFSEDGFLAFNRAYVAGLGELGIASGEQNSIARTNVAPRVNPPSEVSIYAFSYTVPVAPGDDGKRDFVIAGSGEAPEGRGNYRDHAIRLGDVSPEGLAEKARFVLGEMERRMASFGFGWADATVAQLYTVHDVHALLEHEIGGRGALARGLLWHYARPPVADLDYEMDVRGVALERVI